MRFWLLQGLGILAFVLTYVGAYCLDLKIEKWWVVMAYDVGFILFGLWIGYQVGYDRGRDSVRKSYI